MGGMRLGVGVMSERVRGCVGEGRSGCGREMHTVLNLVLLFSFYLFIFLLFYFFTTRFYFLYLIFDFLYFIKNFSFIF